MMNEQDDTNDLIERYLLGNLDGDMLEKFKERLAADETFSNDVALQKIIIRNIRAVGRKEWAQKLQNLHDEIDIHDAKDKPGKLRDKKSAPVESFYRNKYFLSVAASVIVILFSTLLMVTNNKTQNAETIFVVYYQPYPDLEPGTRSLATTDSTLEQQAFKAYNTGNFLESIRLFNLVLDNGENEIVLFYLGNAFLSADQPAKAESAFKKYLVKYTEFAPDSKWYLSMCYIKQRKIAEARKLLEELVLEKNNYSKKAKEVLSKL